MSHGEHNCEEQNSDMKLPEKPIVGYWNGSIHSPDVALLIQNESFDDGKCLEFSTDKAVYDVENNKNKDGTNIIPSYGIKEEVNNEKNVLNKNYSEKFREVTKNTKKQSLQKRNLGAGQKHVTELW